MSDNQNSANAITERGEAAVRKDAEKLLTRLLATAPIILWAIDRDGVITHSEGKGMELVGLPHVDQVRINLFEMFKDDAEITDALVRALAGEEVRFVSQGGPGLFFDNWYMPMRAQDGTVTGVMGLALDATARIKNEREVREKLDLIERQSATIRALATPIIKVWDEVLCLPVIGTVDSARTAEMMQSLLEAAVREQARYVIVDLTGVEVVDTSTADHLIQLFRAANVIGVEGVLCGIRPAVAQTVVALGLELGSVRTMRSLRDALKWCIRASTQTPASRGNGARSGLGQVVPAKEAP
jgi:rsbT co-antagonist protein RsbR